MKAIAVDAVAVVDTTAAITHTLLLSFHPERLLHLLPVSSKAERISGVRDALAVGMDALPRVGIEPTKVASSLTSSTEGERVGEMNSPPSRWELCFPSHAVVVSDDAEKGAETATGQHVGEGGCCCRMEVGRDKWWPGTDRAAGIPQKLTRKIFTYRKVGDPVSV